MAVLTGMLSILSMIWPQWIELIFGLSPDGGDGSLEGLIVLFLFMLTILFFLIAYREWRMRSVLHSKS
jgi:hypothetical protein